MLSSDKDDAVSVYSAADTIGTMGTRMTTVSHRPSPANKKQSLPANLNTLVSGALNRVESDLGTSSHLRKISMVKTGEESPGVQKSGLFNKSKKMSQQQTLVLTFKPEQQAGMAEQMENIMQNGGTSGNSGGEGERPQFSISSSELNMEHEQDAYVPLQRATPTEVDSAFKAMKNNNSYTDVGGLLTPNGNDSFDTRSQTSFRTHKTIAEMEEEEVEEKEERKQEKRKRFWDFWSMVTSIMYALGMTITAVVIYLADVFIARPTPIFLSEYINIYMCLLGMGWLLWLQIDINNYSKAMKTMYKKSNLPYNELMKKIQLGDFNDDGEFEVKITLDADSTETLSQYYSFAQGRHSGSFFLKVGAAGFALGHMVFLGLLLGKQVVYFTDDNPDLEGCESALRVVSYVLQPIYVFLQLYMLFKYSNVIVNRNKGFARFAFMHCITSSLCFWIYAIINETLDALVSKKYFTEKKYCVSDNGDSGSGSYGRDILVDMASMLFNVDADGVHRPNMYADPVTNSSGGGTTATKCFADDNLCGKHYNSTEFSFDATCLMSQMCKCSDGNEIAKYIFSISPYLYPFSIEFSILVVGVWFIMWSNIGNVEQHKKNLEFLPSMSPRASIDSAGNLENDAKYLTADCHSANKGLFSGIIFFVLVIIGIIVYFVLAESDSCEKQDMAIKVNSAFESSLLLVMTVTTIWVYIKIVHLDVNPDPISFLDDLLLFLCIPSFFMYGLINIAPIIDDQATWGEVFTNIIMILQVLIQTPMIVDGLRRCSDSRKNQIARPGRNLLTFLLISNLGIYLWDTLEVKSTSYNATRKEFYGDTVWTLLSHVTLPLCIFYRFHSSVALADIWNSAYLEGSHH